MKLARRIHRVRPSMTLEINAKAIELQAMGEDIVSFSAGEPDYPTPENVKKAGIEAINRNLTRYTPVGGTPGIKDAIIAKFKNENGLIYQRDQIVVSCGAKHSFYNLAQVLWEEGDEVIIPAPYWVSYPDMVSLSGAVPVFAPTSAATCFKLIPEQLQTLITPRTRALVLNSPSNPAGSVYSKRELEALAEVALRNRLLIVWDEIYEKIVFDGFEHYNIASLSDEVKRNCVAINGVSKAYAMTGWRIGYLAAEREIAAAVTKLQGQSTSNPTSISQYAATEALTGPQDETLRRVAELQNKRDFLLQRLEKMPGVSCYKPAGSIYTFPEFSAVFGRVHEGGTIDGSLALTEFLLKEAKVVLVPGVAFGADAHARLSFAVSMENLAKGLDRMAAALGALASETPLRQGP